MDLFYIYFLVPWKDLWLPLSFDKWKIICLPWRTNLQTTVPSCQPHPHLQLDGGIFTVLKAVSGVLGGFFVFLPLMFVLLLRRRVGSARGCGRSTWISPVSSWLRRMTSNTGHPCKWDSRTRGKQGGGWTGNHRTLSLSPGHGRAEGSHSSQDGISVCERHLAADPAGNLRTWESCHQPSLLLWLAQCLQAGTWSFSEVRNPHWHCWGEKGGGGRGVDWVTVGHYWPLKIWSGDCTVCSAAALWERMCFPPGAFACF